jgi:hypothetical protein
LQGIKIFAKNASPNFMVFSNAAAGSVRVHHLHDELEQFSIHLEEKYENFQDKMKSKPTLLERFEEQDCYGKAEIVRKYLDSKNIPLEQGDFKRAKGNERALTIKWSA